MESWMTKSFRCRWRAQWGYPMPWWARLRMWLQRWSLLEAWYNWRLGPADKMRMRRMGARWIEVNDGSQAQEDEDVPVVR